MLILPAFGPYSGGVNMLGPAFRRVLVERPLTAYCLTDRRIHAFDSRMLVAE
jgi:metallophosphoesterase superfamily enzyme